ncbi:hypothetical protein BN946_scf184832.g1, partial [Trametes cinnabarina]
PGDHPSPETNTSSIDERTWFATIVSYNATSSVPFTSASPAELPTVTLARRGYMATAPVRPSLAVSFDILSFFRHLRGFCPRISIQAYCQTLCGVHGVFFHRYLALQFSTAFDVYLDILHEVDQRAHVVLHRDQPNWRMHNACAPCLYHLEGEDDLEYSLLVAIDGNSSLKLVDDAFRSGQPQQDSRTWRTDVFMSSDEVDMFKDDVANAQKKRTPSGASIASDLMGGEAVPTAVPGGSVATDGMGTNIVHPDAPPFRAVPDGGAGHADSLVEEPCESKSVCAERWRNAGPEARKKMFALFAATGIFVCVCRHGHVLVMCDMVRSGELMKYALAIANKLVEVYGPTARIKVGYDIGCEFSKTLSNSSIADRVKDVITLIVPAFHGHSHNRGCQLDWHPLYTDGIGLEDFETSERFFSYSNGAAAGTRLATPFHRHQAIEGVVQSWSMQKHAASGKFIYNNYRQALQIIDEGERVLDVLKRDLHLSAADYERYLREERKYLHSLKSEPPEVSLRGEYVEALQELEQEQRKDTTAIATYQKLDYLIIKEGIDGRQIRAIEREYRFAQVRLQRAEEKVHRLEEQLDIDARWSPSSAEYKQAATEMALRRYRRALDHLERLVIQRLFELKKLGMNGIGYKLREKIGNALKTRAQAIRTALTAYNREATALSPPRPELSWTDVMNMVSIGEFDLLRDSRQDIRSLPWAQVVNRDGMNTYFKVKRAREEINRLNVEMRRLFTALVDEHVDYHHAIEQVKSSDAALAYELAQRQRYHNVVSGHIVEWLLKASRLPGFSGELAYGRRVGRNEGLLDGVSLPAWASYTGQGASTVADADEEDADEPYDMEDGEGIPGVGSAGASGRFVAFVDSLESSSSGTDAL